MTEAGGSKRIRVLVVEDSPVVRELLVYILGRDPEIQVSGTAVNGEEAIEAVIRTKPDIIIMDIHMPRMNGLDATRKIMETVPTPIVIVSGSSSRKEVAATFQALEAGALAIVEKPSGIDLPDGEDAANKLVQTVKLMAEVKVVRRWPRKETVPATSRKPLAAQIKIVAIGASAGGPLVLQTILRGLPKNFPVPIAIVQHMASGFTEGFIEWLGQSSGFPAHVAAHGEQLLAGHAYVAPDGFHMKVEAGNRIALSRDGPENGHRPSVSYLFRSVATVFGSGAVGVLLSGMGKDGAKELLLMKEKGAITIAQDRESAVVPGMPGEAIDLGAAMYVLTPDKIVEVLDDWIGGNSERH
jgi:two-component system, chemotaxis family, protein-glutamate methylesterase/glutaminase